MFFLYDKNTGEVVSASINNVYKGFDTDLFSVVEDPKIPDGSDIGTSKKYDASKNEMRNATSNEKKNFVGVKT